MRLEVPEDLAPGAIADMLSEVTLDGALANDALAQPMTTNNVTERR